jgi:two-component system OmpR family sensor kinase
MHELTHWWNRISLRTKITGVTVLLLTAGLLVAGLGTMAVLRNYLQDEVDAKITLASGKLGGTIQYTGTAESPRCAVSTLPNDYYLAVLDHDGGIICNNREEDATRPIVETLTLERVAMSEGALTLPSTELGGQWRVVVLPASNQLGTDYFTVVILSLIHI